MHIENNGAIYFEETDLPFLTAVGWERAVQTVLNHRAAHGDFPFLYNPCSWQLSSAPTGRLYLT